MSKIALDSNILIYNHSLNCEDKMLRRLAVTVTEEFLMKIDVWSLASFPD